MAEDKVLTREGRDKLEEELDYLQNVRRKEVAAQLKAAIEEGDLRENVGYSEAKRDQAFLEGRIKEIENILRNAQVIDISGSNGHVQLGSTVTVCEEGYEPETFVIVGTFEADAANGRISNESPIGSALMGAEKGDKVNVKTPGGEIFFEIIDVN